MIQLPRLKKKISAFLNKEDGKISKENLIKAGALLSAVAIASLKSAEAGCPVSDPGSHSNHCNSSSVAAAGTSATGSHSHSHGSHSSHGSHGSHGSHFSW